MKWSAMDTNLAPMVKEARASGAYVKVRKAPRSRELMKVGCDQIVGELF
jgi:hypothetical protein